MAQIKSHKSHPSPHLSQEKLESRYGKWSCSTHVLFYTVVFLQLKQVLLFKKMLSGKKKEEKAQKSVQMESIKISLGETAWGDFPPDDP